jgi:hypothetical protein
MSLEESDSLERVAVLRSDLEAWIDALWRAHSYSFAQDLAEGYRDLRQDAKRSKLTNLLARSYNKAEGYLPQTEETPDEDGLR